MAALDELLAAGISFSKIVTIESPKDCVEAAKMRNIPLEKILKSIVLEDKDKSTVMACLPANKKLDLKEIARLGKLSRLSFAPPEKVFELTGCVAGSVPPFIPENTTTPVIWDTEIKNHPIMNISVGDPKITYMIAPCALEKLTKPLYAKICLNYGGLKPAGFLEARIAEYFPAGVP